MKFSDTIIYETKNFVGEVPQNPHIPRLDGWHIRIRAKEKYFESRIEFEPKMAVEVMRMTMLLGEAMISGMKNSKTQTFGEALTFPNKSTGFYDDFEPFNEGDIEEIKKQINNLEKTDKYDMAKWKLHNN